MKLEEQVKELGVRGYSGTPEEDTMILDWWTELISSHTLDTIFSKSCYSLSTFYRLFTRPNWLFYMKDSKGLTLAVWAEPMFSTACVGVWVAPRARKSKNVLNGMKLIYYTLFTIYERILGITKQENLLPQHTKLGYTVVGSVDGLLDDQPCWLVLLTREAYQTSKLNPERS